MRKLGVVLAIALAAPVLAAETWKVDPVHSTVDFKCQHFGAGKFIGRFNETTGTVKWDDQDPSKSSFEVDVKVESVDTHEPNRDKHLKSPDFFNAKQFPTITFKSTKIEKKGDKFAVTGDLTLHGETHPVTAAFEIFGRGKDPKGTERIGGEATFKIKRSEWGMKNMVGPLGDEVELTVGIEATKE